MDTFNSQYGGSLLPTTNPEFLFYRANLRRQKGYGLGGLFGTLARYVIPFAKNILWPHAKRALRDIAVDVVDDRVPFKQAIKSRSIGALKSVGRDIMNQTGRGRGRVRKRKKKSKSVKSKVKNINLLKLIKSLQKKSSPKKVKKPKKKVKKISKKNKKAFANVGSIFD